MTSDFMGSNRGCLWFVCLVSMDFMLLYDLYHWTGFHNLQSNFDSGGHRTIDTVTWCLLFGWIKCIIFISISIQM